MYDEAINVLLDGLDRQPGYTTARVSLGKIYLEKGQIDEAIEEFEKVVGAIPDNLFAQKKLAEINKMIGNTEKAIFHFRKVLELNPLDDEARETLDTLVGGGQKAAEEAESEIGEASPDEPAEAEEAVSFEAEAIEIPDTEEIEEIEGADAVEELEDIDFEEYKQFSEFIGERIHEPEEEELTDIGSAEITTPDEVEKDDEQEEFLSVEKSVFSFDDIQDTPIDLEEEPALSDVDKLVFDADEFIRTDQFIKAIEMYSDILNSAPENNKVKQRMEELRSYLRMIGKDTESLVSRLEEFLQGVNNRRDDFFGSS